MSLRKRLRQQASEELDGLVEKLQERAAELTAGVDTMWGSELLKLAAGGRTNTLKHDLVTKMTNHREHELEKFFNRQQDLPIEEPDKGKSK